MIFNLESRNWIMITPHVYKSWRGSVFTSVYLSVCVYMCVCLCEHKSSRTDAWIWTRFSLNGCLPYWLEPFWNWWPLVKSQGHSDAISFFFLHNPLLTYVRLKWNSICCWDKPLIECYFNFIKVEWAMTSLCRHSNFLQTTVHISCRFYWTHKIHRSTWYQYKTT